VLALNYFPVVFPDESQSSQKENDIVVDSEIIR
jgi:hypothetical protein